MRTAWFKTVLAASAAGLAVTTFALTAPASAALSSATITHSAAVPYGSCPTGSVVVSVTVPTRHFVPGERVPYRVTLTNRGTRACGSTVGGVRTHSLAGLLGQCGPLPLHIVNARGVAVYPPFEAILCPMFIGPRLQAHQTLAAAGSWNQMQGGGRPARVASLVPRGTYHLVIAGKVGVPLVLAQPEG